jgi:hypothetical protein
VIHVSQLKKALPPGEEVSTDADLSCVFAVTTPTPLQILETRLRKVGNKAVAVGKVQWNSLPESWTTWEDLTSIESRSE